MPDLFVSWNWGVLPNTMLNVEHCSKQSKIESYVYQALSIEIWFLSKIHKIMYSNVQQILVDIPTILETI